MAESQSLRTSQALLAPEILVVGPDSDFDNRTAIDHGQHAHTPTRMWMYDVSRPIRTLAYKQPLVYDVSMWGHAELQRRCNRNDWQLMA